MRASKDFDRPITSIAVLSVNIYKLVEKWRRGLRRWNSRSKKGMKKMGMKSSKVSTFGIDTIFPISKNYEKLGRCRWKEKRNVKWRQSARQITGMQRLRRAPIYFATCSIRISTKCWGRGGVPFPPRAFYIARFNEPERTNPFPIPRHWWILRMTDLTSFLKNHEYFFEFESTFLRRLIISIFKNLLHYILREIYRFSKRKREEKEKSSTKNWLVSISLTSPTRDQ